MSSFLVKKPLFQQHKSGLKDVELKNVRPQWENSEVGDEVVLLCGRETMRRRIVKIHRDSS